MWVKKNEESDFRYRREKEAETELKKLEKMRGWWCRWGQCDVGGDKKSEERESPSCCQCRGGDGLLLPLLLCNNLSDRWLPTQQGLFSVTQMKCVTFLPLSQFSAATLLHFCKANKDWEKPSVYWDVRHLKDTLGNCKAGGQQQAVVRSYFTLKTDWAEEFIVQHVK